MEINIQIKNVQKPEDIVNAFAALGQNSRPPLRRGRREDRASAAATNAATRRSPSLTLTDQELEALQHSHPQGAQNLLSSTDAEASAGGSGVRPKMNPRPFSAFQRPGRPHEGRTLSPGPYYRRGDQLGAADKSATPRPTVTQAFMDQAMPPPARPLLIRRRQQQTSPRRSSSRTPPTRTPVPRTPSPRARSSRAQSSTAQSSRAQSSRAQSSRAQSPRVPVPLTPRQLDSRSPSCRRLDSRSPTHRRLDSRTPTARQRSRTPPATAAKAKSKPPSSSSTTPPRAPSTGKDLYITPTMPSTIKSPKNLTRYAVDWESFEVAALPVQDDMKRYVEALCASSAFQESC